MVKFEDLDGPNAPSDKVNEFVTLVVTGGAVDENFVRQGLNRPGVKIVFAKINGKTVGVAALKVPALEYRDRLANIDKSGHPLPQKTYPFELGYVSVVPDQTGKGIGRYLVQRVIDHSQNKGLFSTTSNPHMEKLLSKSGFIKVGNSWESRNKEKLHLWIRTMPAQKSS